MIFEPDAILALPFLTAALWRLGGAGVKLLRRVGVPLAVILFAARYPYWLIPIFALSMIGALTLPYGTKIENKLGILYGPYVALVGLAFGACLLPLCIHYAHWTVGILGLVILSASFPSLMALSRKNLLEWGWVEVMIGFEFGFFAMKIIRG